jgi:hypothetical protein
MTSAWVIGLAGAALLFLLYAILYAIFEVGAQSDPEGGAERGRPARARARVDRAARRR